MSVVYQACKGCSRSSLTRNRSNLCAKFLWVLYIEAENILFELQKKIALYLVQLIAR